MIRNDQIKQRLRRLGFSEEQIARAVIRPPSCRAGKAKAANRSGLDRMNKTERAYAAHLDELARAGRIKAWWYEPVKLRLGKGCYYTPDFLVQQADDTLLFVEVKGYLRDDAAVKFKVARRLFPWAQFTMVRRTKGHWKEVRI